MRHFTTAVLLVALCVGCSLNDDGDGDATITADELPELVLQPTDLPRLFLRYEEGPQTRADQPAGSRSEPTRFGRQDGWKARYRRPGTATTRGPLVIESRADRFETSSGAKDELAAIEESEYEELSEPTLGDEARLFTLHQGNPGTGVRFYLVAWREDNLVALILINGFEGKMRLNDALTLSRKQQRRIAAAARPEGSSG